MKQNTYSGYGSYKELDRILNKHSPNKIFVVVDKKSYDLSGVKKLIGKIVNKYNNIRFHDFKINPQIEDVKKGVILFNKNKCDFIIGAGGGSVMDVAKAISILSVQKGDLQRYIKNKTNLSNRKTISVMIPTTAGTGSESTHFSVIYINKNKYSLEHPSILPDYAILDPIFTKNLPPYITACTGMDALCQAIESLWSVNSTRESIKYSKKAVELILPNIIKAVNQPDLLSRENMLNGSNFAGKAIAIAKTTAPHSVSYPITSYFNIPHGHAVSLTLSHFIEFNYSVSSGNLQDSRGIEFVKDRMNELFKWLEVRTAKEARKKIIRLMEEIKMNTHLSDFGIDNEDIKIIVKKGFNPQRMKNNPKLVSESDLKNILKSIK
jgi:alcohol dehydrogenase class IV